MNSVSWILPANLLNESIMIMRPHGIYGNEGLALWYGPVVGGQAEVSHVVEVYGSGFITTPSYMSLSLGAMSKLTDVAEQLGGALIGQIHSHPGLMLELSDLDRIHGIRSLNYLSVVFPYYAQRNLNSFMECGVFVYEQNDYRRLNVREIEQYLIVTKKRVQKIRCEV